MRSTSETRSSTSRTCAADTASGRLPAARTAWHSHPLGQTLRIVEGTALVQARGGEVVEVSAGQTVYSPPGEEHWHGAAPDSFMTHLALWETPDGEESAQWGATSPMPRTPRGRRADGVDDGAQHPSLS